MLRRIWVLNNKIMDETVVHDKKIFSGVNFAEKELRKREFSRCEFINFYRIQNFFG